MQHNKEKFAVILAGGKGTRLAPFTATLPKPLMPIGDKAILEIILSRLSDNGVKSAILAVNHMAHLIQAYFGNGEKFGISLEYSIENSPLGTVGPISLIDKLPKSFIVMNGDILTDISFEALCKSHEQSKKLLTVCVSKRKHVIDYGVIGLDIEKNTVNSFKEKPIEEFYVSMGIYVFERSLLNLVPKDKSFGFDQLIKKMISKKIDINIFRHSGYWLDIGRPDDYAKANEDFSKL